MSIPTLLQSGSNGVSCGRENPLGVLAKAVQKDTSLFHPNRASLPSTSRPTALARPSSPSPAQQDHRRFFSPPAAHHALQHPPSSATAAALPDWSTAFLESFQQRKPSQQPQIHIATIADQFRYQHLCTLSSRRTSHGPISSGPSLTPSRTISTLFGAILILQHRFSIIARSSMRDQSHLTHSDLLHHFFYLTNLNVSYTTRLCTKPPNIG